MIRYRCAAGVALAVLGLLSGGTAASAQTVQGTATGRTPNPRGGLEIPGLTVELFEGNRRVGAATTAANGSFSIPITGVTGPEVRLQFSGTDSDGVARETVNILLSSTRTHDIGAVVPVLETCPPYWPCPPAASHGRSRGLFHRR